MDNKAAFRQAMQAELHAWEAELDSWSARDERADGEPELRREQQQMLDDLHEQRLQARQYLDELERDGDWSQLKPKMETLWTKIRAQIAAIKAWA